MPVRKSDIEVSHCPTCLKWFQGHKTSFVVHTYVHIRMYVYFLEQEVCTVKRTGLRRFTKLNRQKITNAHFYFQPTPRVNFCKRQHTNAIISHLLFPLGEDMKTNSTQVLAHALHWD